MKQKKNSDALVTKKHLDKTLDRSFAEFDRKVDEKFVRSELNFDLKLDNLERRVDEKAQRYRDEILDSNDKLAKTLETIWKLC